MMYYSRSSEKFRDVKEFAYHQDRDSLLPYRVDDVQHLRTSWKRVYSFRTSRPKNDSHTAVVPGETLIRNRGAGLEGVASYLNSYKAALQSLDDEAGQVSTDSGYGIMDKGHYFSSFTRNVVISTICGATQFTVTPDGFHPRSEILFRPFCSAVTVYPSPAYYLPGEEGQLPVEVVNTIQELALSTMPDKIHGSIGQDLVDIAQLPHILAHLATIGRELTQLRETWAKLSVKVRHAIDVCIRDKAAAPKWALRSAGSGYLEWLFVLSPYVDDIRAVIRFLSGVSSALLKRYSFTRNQTALESSQRSNSGYYWGGNRSLIFDHTEVNTYSVHLSIAWVRRGPLPSDNTFASKAAQLNRSLGVWYPSLLWDLTPWTWLVDWCTHIGASIDDIYAISHSAYRPAYAWATVRNTVTYDGRFVPFMNADKYADIQTNRFTASNRSLFRFPVQVTGLVRPSFTSLSSGQKSILAALGLSHLK